MRFYLKKSAEKDLAKIHKDNKRAAVQIEAFLDSLEFVDDLSTLPNAKKLKGVENGWRFRVGEYRIESQLLKTSAGWQFAKINEIAKDEEFLEIQKIGPRQNAYKK